MVTAASTQSKRTVIQHTWYLNAKEVGCIGNKGLLVAKVESPDTSRHDLPHHTPTHIVSANDHNDTPALRHHLGAKVQDERHHAKDDNKDGQGGANGKADRQ